MESPAPSSEWLREDSNCVMLPDGGLEQAYPDDPDSAGIAAEVIAMETVRSWEVDTEYWDRVSSAAFDGADDAFEQMAEQWESSYRRCTGKRSRGKRPVHRKEVLRDEEGNAVGKIQPKVAGVSMPSTPAPPVPTPAAPVSSSAPTAAAPKTTSPSAASSVAFDPVKILAIADKYEKKLSVTLGAKPQIPQLTSGEVADLVAGYSHMLAALVGDAGLRRRYGYSEAEDDSARIPFGGDVPSYFANVGGQSIHRRKVLTVLGLRNLVHFGGTIYSQLNATAFSGDPRKYGGDVGLNLMRRVTGNVVDLDTTVLRCSDGATLNVINACNRHKGLPTFSSTSDFGNSDQAQEIAINCAEQALQQFSKKMKLTVGQERDRKVAVSQISKPIPISRNNTERGHTPLWHYVNAGQDSFHANVPTMEDVIGALLLAPIHCVRHWAVLHSGLYGTAVGVAPRAKIDAFFEDCVVDSCFNMKWKSIEEFGRQLEREGSIPDVLAKLQMENQQVFTAELFESDDEVSRDKEIAAMWKVTEGSMGRDGHGKVRSITLSDVTEWVRSN